MHGMIRWQVHLSLRSSMTGCQHTARLGSPERASRHYLVSRSNMKGLIFDQEVIETTWSLAYFFSAILFAPSYQLHNQIEDSKGQIRIYARVRPMNFHEKEAGYKEVRATTHFSSDKVRIKHTRTRPMCAHAIMLSSPSPRMCGAWVRFA